MRAVWLASYPKSGNTWMRMLIANLAATDAGPVDINLLPVRGGIASARAPFDDLLLIDSGLLTHEEIDRLRPRVYEELSRDHDDDVDDAVDAAVQVRFMKVHDAYTSNPDGEPLLAGARGADGAIVIVRDPRDVAPSLANHLGTDVDHAIAFMNDDDSGFCVMPGRQFPQLRQRLSGWSGHVRSWLDQTDIPVHVTRFEALKRDPVGAFRAALAFAGQEATEQQIERAVRFADFEELKRQEREKGFREASRIRPEQGFFRRGIAGAWRDELSSDQVARIEEAHGPMMLRMGYALAGEGARSERAGGERP